MGRRGYPPEFRGRVLHLVESGRKIADIARDLQVSQQTIYAWRRQDHIDRGLELDLTSSERTELAVARRRIRELETELTIAKRAVEELTAHTDPKGGSRRSG